MLIGTLDALRRYPVKSLRGEALTAVKVGPTGIEGDRADALFLRAGNSRVGKTYRGKEHDRLHLFTNADAALAAAAEHGADVELRHGDHFFDDAPVSLLVDCWLAELDAHVGYAVEWERFRPNLFVRAAGDFNQDEIELVDAQLKVGTVRRLRVRCPIERCVTVTYHPQGAPSDPRILAYLAQRRNACIGCYCDVIEPGSACIGDTLIRA